MPILFITSKNNFRVSLRFVTCLSLSLSVAQITYSHIQSPSLVCSLIYSRHGAVSGHCSTASLVAGLQMASSGEQTTTPGLPDPAAWPQCLVQSVGGVCVHVPMHGDMICHGPDVFGARLENGTQSECLPQRGFTHCGTAGLILSLHILFVGHVTLPGMTELTESPHDFGQFFGSVTCHSPVYVRACVRVHLLSATTWHATYRILYIPLSYCSLQGNFWTSIHKYCQRIPCSL